MSTVAVVTGANKGIGFAIVRSLCKKLDKSDVVYLTSRNESLGLDAVEKLKKEGLSPCYHQLDIGDEGSAKKLKEHLEKTHGGVDILINNAGVLLREEEIPFIEKAERTMKTNFFDTLKAYNILSPAIRSNGRVVFVSSGLGQKAYNDCSDELKKSFCDAKTEEDVQKLMKKFVSDVKAGNHVELGWPAGSDGYPSYNVSKLGIIAVTKVFAENLKQDPRQGILINSCSPGYVATDLTRNQGHRTIDEGAVTSVVLALLARDSSHPQGQYMDANQEIQDFLG
ncbi:carbonyl reductase [NADPH] 3-like [Apostichopus japonicus]|uniref:carbonyl reductase [NADPH] 3-like n=1 Tax=Stichopus japonicus TaxID=307972 RepID=UPI003AB6E1B7